MRKIRTLPAAAFTKGQSLLDDVDKGRSHLYLDKKPAEWPCNVVEAGWNTCLFADWLFPKEKNVLLY